jgi:hypothetical protein
MNIAASAWSGCAPARCVNLATRPKHQKGDSDMAIQWIGDDNDVIANVDKYRLHLWRGEDDWNWTLAIDNAPAARGFAATLQDAKHAAIEALEDYRSGQLQ